MRSAAVSVFLAITLLAVSPVAEASPFQVRSCGPFSWSAFTASNSSSASLVTTVGCPAAPGQILTGIVVATKQNADSASGATAEWSITAPPTLKLLRLDVQRSLGKRSDLWQVQVRTNEGQVLDTCHLAGQLVCTQGDPNGDAAASYDGLNTSAVRFVVTCIAGQLQCVGRSLTQAWIAVYSSVAVVDDPAPPVVQPLSGPLLEAGWRSGSARVDVAASDASGVKAVVVRAAGVNLGERREVCDYSRMRPCTPSVAGGFMVDTARLPDGTHALEAVVTDAADQPSVRTATVRVDRTAPAAPLGLIAERAPDGTVALSWTNPGQGSAAPIVAARYVVCDALGVGCSAAVRVAGLGIRRLAPLAVPAGERVVRVWLEDAAGHSNPARAAEVRVTPPGVNPGPPSVVQPPVLLPEGPAPSARLRITRARRQGSTLTLSGTIARAARTRVVAEIARKNRGRSLARARTTPRAGRWSIKLRLPPALRRSRVLYLTLDYAGQSDLRNATLHRRLARTTTRRGSAAVEFSVEAK